MKEYTAYTEEITWLEKTLTGTLGLRLSYIKSKSEWIDRYMNYISNKFFSNKENISQYDIEERVSVIESALEEYNILQQDIQANENLDSDIKSFLIKSIEESKAKAEIAKRSTFFEAEKSWYDIIFEWSTFEIKKNANKIKDIGLWTKYEEKKQSYLHDINTLQTETYGPRISDCDDEKQIILSLCNTKYIANNNKLTKEENELFASFLDTFKNNISSDVVKSTKNLPARGNLPVQTIMKGTEHIKKHFYPNIERWQVQEKGKIGYAAPFSRKVREYPDKKEDTFNKILTTIGHEDAGHMLRSDNQEKNWIMIAGPWYENIEEGITKLNEWLLKYSLDEYPLIPNDTFIAVFIGENYNFEDSYHMLKAWKKLNTTWEITKRKEDILSKSAFELTQRIKCYYPRDEVWSNRKDVIYFRGEKK